MVDRARFVELLKARETSFHACICAFQGLQTPDNSVRQQAEKMYQQAKQSEPDNLILGMMPGLSSVSAACFLHKRGPSWGARTWRRASEGGGCRS